MTKQEATDKVLKYKKDHNVSDRELSKKLFLSRNTMYKRLKDNQWKEIEIQIIKQLDNGNE